MVFYYVYKSLAHPEKNGLVQPVALEERLKHIEVAKAQLGAQMPWLADSMTNELKHAFGDRNNSEFVISPEGKVVVARSWSDPAALRKDLEGLVGKSETTTTIADLNLKTKTLTRPEKIASGVVPRVKRVEGAQPLITRSIPAEGDSETETPPLYVKVRAELAASVIRSGGADTLYLGFHIDPIHKVHWNNLAPALTFSLKAPDGVTLSQTEGTAPKPEGIDADLDPREFLIDIAVDEEVPGEPMILEVKYFACDDGDAWCKAITQRYEVYFEADRDGGRLSRGGGPGGKGGNNTSMRGNGKGSGRQMNADQMMARMDSNKDGKIAKDEARGPFVQRFDSLDADKDGFLSKAELQKAVERMRR